MKVNQYSFVSLIREGLLSSVSSFLSHLIRSSSSMISYGLNIWFFSSTYLSQSFVARLKFSVSYDALTFTMTPLSKLKG